MTTPRDLAAWLEHLQHQHPQAIAMGLERVREVARRLALGKPGRHVIVVGGTNGKGSTVAYLEAMARAAGLRVGAYTSPHLLRFNERLRFDGEEASDAAWCEAFDAVEAARLAPAPVALTYFEAVTLAALWLLQGARPDLAVLEVGLGGRLDAVNLIDADCAVITTVDLDHMDYLGPDRESIGAEKAGILRVGTPVVLGDLDPPSSVLRRAYALGAPMLRRRCDWFVEEREDGAGFAWREPGDRLLLPAPALAGPLQPVNAGMAITALRALELPVDEAALRAGVAGARLRGRLERVDAAVPGGVVEVRVDVGHNPQAADTLAQWLDARAAEAAGEGAEAAPVHAVYGALGDKDIAGVVAALGGRIAHWHLAGLDAEGPRGLPAAALRERVGAALAADGAAHAPIDAHPDVAAALAAALRAAGPGGLVLAFGSFLTAAAALRALGAD